MISHQLLRRYQFFGFMDQEQQRAVANIAEDVTYEAEATIFNADTPANTLYFLIEGSISYYFEVEDNYGHKKELYITDINPGEIFGISACIDPNRYTATMRANRKSRVVQIHAEKLHRLCENDAQLANGLLQEIARAAMERLGHTRVQLAASRAIEPEHI